MDKQLTAEDLWPIVAKMSPREMARLAGMALRFADGVSRREVINVHAQDFADEDDAVEDDALSWEGYGWDSMDSART